MITDTTTYPGADPAALDRLTDPGMLAPYLKAVAVGRGFVGAYIDQQAYRSIADRLLGAANHSVELTMPPTRQPVAVGAKKGYDGNPDTDVRGGTGACARVTVWIEGRHHPKIAEGAGSNASELPDTGFKGAASDAVKRAWANMGLGVALSRLPQRKADPKNERAIAAVIAEWRDLLDQWQAKVEAQREAAGVTAAAVPVDPAEATGDSEVGDNPGTTDDDGHQEQSAPKIPEGHRLDESTGEVVPTEAATAPESPRLDISTTAADRDAARARASGAPTPDEAPSGDLSPLARVAGQLGAPGEGTPWVARQDWLRERLGGRDESIGALKASGAAKWESALADDGKWQTVLEYLAALPTPTAEAA